MMSQKEDPQNMYANIGEDAEMGTVADQDLPEPQDSDDNTPPPLVESEENKDDGGNS